MSDVLIEARYSSEIPTLMVSDTELLKRAVNTCRGKPKARIKHPRWSYVMDRFSLGSTYSKGLCRRFGFDPEELI